MVGHAHCQLKHYSKLGRIWSRSRHALRRGRFAGLQKCQERGWVIELGHGRVLKLRAQFFNAFNCRAAVNQQLIIKLRPWALMWFENEPARELGESKTKGTTHGRHQHPLIDRKPPEPSAEQAPSGGNPVCQHHHHADRPQPSCNFAGN